MGVRNLEYYVPFDFGGILGFPHEEPNICWQDHFLEFIGHSSVVFHIKSFMKAIADLDVVHEDIMMRMFLYTFDGKATK